MQSPSNPSTISQDERSTVSLLPEKKSIIVGTHDGVFQCDEVAAVVFLQLLHNLENVTFVRSRVAENLAKTDIRVDVGGKYDAKEKNFDHHQRGFAETFSPAHKTLLSSAGLIYKQYGREMLLKLSPDELKDKAVLEKIFFKVYSFFVQAIDEADYGKEARAGEAIDQSTLSARVGRLNQSWTAGQDAKEQDAKFALAMDLVRLEFFATLKYLIEQWLPAYVEVEKSFLDRYAVHASGRVMELERWCPYDEYVKELEGEHNVSGSVLFVLLPQAGNWKVQCMPAHAKNVQRLQLPAAWNGKLNEELQAITDIPDAIAVPNGRFTGICKSRDGAYSMIVKTLATELKE